MYQLRLRVQLIFSFYRPNVAMTRSAFQRRRFSGPWRYGFQFHMSEMYVYGVELETV